MEDLIKGFNYFIKLLKKENQILKGPKKEGSKNKEKKRVKYLKTRYSYYKLQEEFVTEAYLKKQAALKEMEELERLKDCFIFLIQYKSLIQIEKEM